MPTYAYRCNNCGHEFEQRQRMSDDPLTQCPVCQGEIRRVINSVGIVFKGSGFYVTDNRNGKTNGKTSTTKKVATDENATNTTSNDNSDTKGDEAKSTKKAEKPAKKSAD